MGMDVTEIKEALEADPQSEFDPGESEKANRRLIQWGVIPKDGTETLAQSQDLRAQHWKTYSWKLLEEESLTYWVFNYSGSAMTSGMNVRFTGTWKFD